MRAGQLLYQLSYIPAGDDGVQQPRLSLQFVIPLPSIPQGWNYSCVPQRLTEDDFENVS